MNSFYVNLQAELAEAKEELWHRLGLMVLKQERKFC